MTGRRQVRPVCVGAGQLLVEPARAAKGSRDAGLTCGVSIEGVAFDHDSGR
jgi:hypothetical protein